MARTFKTITSWRQWVTDKIDHICQEVDKIAPLAERISRIEGCINATGKRGNPNNNRNYAINNLILDEVRKVKRNIAFLILIGYLIADQLGVKIPKVF